MLYLTILNIIVKIHKELGYLVYSPTLLLPFITKLHNTNIKKDNHIIIMTSLTMCFI